MKTIRLCSIVLFVAPLFLGLACKKEKDGTSGQVSIEMENGTAADLRLEEGEFTPTVFGMKIVSVRLLVNSSDCTSSACPMVWTAEGCPASISESEIDGKMFEYMQSPGCEDGAVEDYFDFALSTDEVNENLNSQNQPILPGTYKYAIVSWCEGEAQSDSLQFQTSDMSEPYQTELNGCSGITSAEADPPLEIGEGDSVVVNLSYDLANAVKDEASGDSDEYCYTSDDQTMTRCLAMPEFTLTFSK